MHEKMLRQTRIDRLMNIFFRMAITMFCLIWAALFSSLLGPVLYFTIIVILLLVMGCMLVFTLGTIFAMPGNPLGKVWGFFQKLTNGSDSVLGLTQICFNATKWLALAGIILSVLTIVMLAMNRHPSKVGKIVWLSIFIVVSAIVFAFQIITGGMQ